MLRITPTAPTPRALAPTATQREGTTMSAEDARGLLTIVNEACAAAEKPYGTNKVGAVLELFLQQIQYILDSSDDIRLTLEKLRDGSTSATLHLPENQRAVFGNTKSAPLTPEQDGQDIPPLYPSAVLYGGLEDLKNYIASYNRRTKYQHPSDTFTANQVEDMTNSLNARLQQAVET